MFKGGMIRTACGAPSRWLYALRLKLNNWHFRRIDRAGLRSEGYNYSKFRVDHERHFRRMAEERVGELLESLAEVAKYSACWDAEEGGYCTSGSVRLRRAFELLGWEDPQVCEAEQCSEPGCKERGIYKTLMSGGYHVSTCFEHKPKEEDGGG